MLPFLQVIIRSILITAFQSGQENYFELLFSSSIVAMSPVRAPVFGAHQFFGTSEHNGKAHGSLLSGWMNYNYTACCWFPTSGNILIIPPQFWQIRFESYWLRCSKCRILVLLQSFLLHNGFSTNVFSSSDKTNIDQCCFTELNVLQILIVPFLQAITAGHMRVLSFESWKYFMKNCTWMKFKIQQNFIFFSSLVVYVSSHNNNNKNNNINAAPCIPYYSL